MINWIAFNKSFIFPQLKNTSENECNFSAEERTRKNEHGFSFLEAVKVHMTRISIFLQAKNAQTRTNSNCGKPNVSKNGSPIFYKRNRFTKVLFNKDAFSKKWGWARRAHASAKRLPPFLGKKHFY